MRAPTLSNKKVRAQCLAAADELLGGWRVGGSDVAALSLNHETKPVAETLMVEAHGIHRECDPRYKAAIAARAARDEEEETFHLLYPAADVMSAAELAERINEARALLARLERMHGQKTFANLLRRIIGGESITTDDVRRWMPRIERMRGEGVFE